MNKAGAGEASGLNEVHMVKRSPQSFKYYISDPGMKFEESAHLVTLLSEIYNFGPYEETLEDWQLRPSNNYE